MREGARWPIALVASVVLSVAALAIAGATRAGGPDRTGAAEQVLVFADEFDGDGLDPTRWTTCYWWDEDGCTNAGTEELQWYVPDNVLVSGGVLRLRAQRGQVRGSDGKDHPYTSGMVTTGRSEDDQAQEPRFGFQYGRVEARMRMPDGKGLWPALWLLPLTHESRPEIDVMEVLGDTPSTLRAHYRYVDDRGEPVTLGHTWRGEDTSADWHTYGLRWTPDELVWLVDGREQWRFDEGEHVPHEPMYLLANLAVGGEWPGDPAASTDFPSTLEIDYVRIWQAGG